MNLKRGQVLRGYKGIVCGTLALGLASCSMPKLPSLGGPPRSSLRRWTAPLLIAERTRLVAERTDLKSPLLSPNTDAEREAELTQLNGKLYTVEKAQFAKSCPAVANSPASSVVR